MRRDEGLYVGSVMHRRLRPKTHRLKYSVFSLLIDIHRLPALNRRLRLFSHNRFNLYSVYDRDLGDGGPLKPHLMRVARKALESDRAERFLMLCYPRILGYVFNPLTVYYGLDAGGAAVVAIYEVTNTFGERHTYAIPVDDSGDGTIRQCCDKVFHVSPFNAVGGHYSFRTRLPDSSASVAILFRDETGPLLAAHFAGDYRPLTDRTLSRLLLPHGFLTMKVWLAIHYEALKLWRKKLRFHKKPPVPATSVTVPHPRGSTDTAA